MRSALGWAVSVWLIGWAASARAENLLTNPDFDQDTLGWTVFVGTALDLDSSDEGACPASGSGFVHSGPYPGAAFSSAILSQCFPVGGRTEIAASVSYRDGATFEQVGVTFHVSLDCSDENPQTALSPVFFASPGTWSRMAMPTAAIPAGTNSIQFLAGGTDPGGGDFTIQLDRAYFGTPDRIFSDGFENDQDGAPVPCRWSPASP